MNSGARRDWPPTRRSYEPFHVVSALQKAIRRSDPDAALYWAAELCKSGYPDWAWRRLVVVATEDVGPVPGLVADLQALIEMDRDARKHQGKRADPAGSLFLMAHAVIRLCQAPKSRIVDWAFMHHLSDNVERREIPDEALDVHTREGRARGRDWTHFLEESGRLVQPDDAARARGYASMNDELEHLSARYEESFEKRHRGRKRELPGNPWRAKNEPPAGPTLFEDDAP